MSYSPESDKDKKSQAIDTLQQLGLRNYEAKCFVGLTAVGMGDAKKIAEVSDVPRTRVYEAMRVLESKGLIEILHYSPKRYRAISCEAAIALLKNRYATRFENLRQTLEHVEEEDGNRLIPE
jgi:sugar-specific transcriptional regulator TrmB